MEKPRIKYGTLAWMIERYITEAQQPGGRPLGVSHYYTLRTVQRSTLGAVTHADLKPIDFIDYCKARRAKAIKPQTINHDMTYTSGVLKHAVQVWEMDDHGLEMYRKAKPQLVRQQLVSKSEQRDRLPTADELSRLRAFFVEQNKRPKNRIDMVLVMDAELVTGRRISELCRIERQHVNVEKRTCWIYNLKNSKGKGFHAEFALIEGAWDLFERRLAEIANEPAARLFPFISASCSARYTDAKNQLDIKGLRMHDNRAACFVRLLDKGYSSLQVRKGISLHRNPNTFENVYARIKAADLHNGPASKVAVS